MYAPGWSKKNGWSFGGWKTQYFKPVRLLVWYGWLTPQASQLWQDAEYEKL
jgi:hypothetical protein